jgi:hypothetical protein
MMNVDKPVLQSTMDFSYGQFMVFDQAVHLPGTEWSDRHFSQGFTRQKQNVSFRTLLDHGPADLRVFTVALNEPPDEAYERIIRVPFETASGTVLIEAPDETGSGRSVRFPPGHYALTSAQALDGDGERIDLFFERLSEPLLTSKIILADAELSPELPLLETAETVRID